MYKHILVPTDGSSLAGRGIRAGVRLAKAVGARISGVYVAPPFIPSTYGAWVVYYPGPFSAGEYKKLTEKTARKALAVC